MRVNHLFHIAMIFIPLVFSCSKEKETYERTKVLHLDFNSNVIDKGDFKNIVNTYGLDYTEDSLNTPESAIYFDGEDDCITVENDNSLDLSDGFSFCAWINPEKGGGSYIFHKQFDEGGGGPYSFDFYYGHIRLIIYLKPADPNNNIELSSRQEIQRNVWQHVAATYDGELCKIYYNGKVDTTKNIGKVDIRTSEKLLGIGTYLWAYPRVLYRGKMDNLRIYNKALSEEEIMKLYDDYE